MNDRQLKSLAIAHSRSQCDNVGAVMNRLISPLAILIRTPILNNDNYYVISIGGLRSVMRWTCFYLFKPVRIVTPYIERPVGVYRTASAAAAAATSNTAAVISRHLRRYSQRWS